MGTLHMSTSCGETDLSMAENVDRSRDCVCNNNTEEEQKKNKNKEGDDVIPPQQSSSILPPFLQNMTREEAINAILHRKGDYIDGSDIYLGPPKPPRRINPEPPSEDAVFEALEGAELYSLVYIGPRRTYKPSLETLMLEELDWPPGRCRGDSVEGRSGVKRKKKKTNKNEGSSLSVHLKSKQRKNKKVATC